MLRNSVIAPALSAGALWVLCSCFGLGCDEGDGHYYAYRPGPGPAYRRASFSGAIRFDWSVAGTAAESKDGGGAVSDEDAGASDAGAISQSACEAIGATQFQALLLDQGTIVAAFQSRCSAGTDIFRVGSNDYTANAALVNDDGVPLTETKVIPSFVVAPGETQLVRVTFDKLASTH